MILQRGVILAEIVSAENAVIEQILIDFACGLGAAQNELVEEWISEAQTKAVDLAEFFGGVMRFLIAQVRTACKPVLPSTDI